MFTKEHYNAIAKIISLSLLQDACGQEMAKVCYRRLAKRFMDTFAKENPRFDKAKFTKACNFDSY